MQVWLLTDEERTSAAAASMDLDELTFYFHLTEESVYCLNSENKFYLLYDL